MIDAILFIAVAIAAFCIGLEWGKPNLHHFTMRMGGRER